MTCFNDDLYRIDSCGVIGEVFEYCYELGCSDDQCVGDTQSTADAGTDDMNDAGTDDMNEAGINTQDASTDAADAQSDLDGGLLDGRVEDLTDGGQTLSDAQPLDTQGCACRNNGQNPIRLPLGTLLICLTLLFFHRQRQYKAPRPFKAEVNPLK